MSSTYGLGTTAYSLTAEVQGAEGSWDGESNSVAVGEGGGGGSGNDGYCCACGGR